MTVNITNISWYIVYFDGVCKDIATIEKDSATTVSHLNNFITYIDGLNDDDVKPSGDESDRILALLLIILTELTKSNLAAYYIMAWSTALSLYKIFPYLSTGGKMVLKTEIVKLHNTYRQAFQVLLEARVASDSLSNLNLYEPRYTPLSNVAMAYGAIASLLIQFVS
jgi:hypothetical protein